MSKLSSRVWTESSLMGALKEFFTAMDLHYYVDVRIVRDPSYAKAIVEVRGNFKTTDDLIDDAWENFKP